jgi:CheY-like chemotaxis protein
MDDDPSVREVLTRTLELADFEVEAASDGEEAVQRYSAAREAERPFDVVVLDLTVPGQMGGKEALIHLREIDPRVKAVVISAYSDDPVMADCERYGFRAALEKPFRRQHLTRVVSDLASEGRRSQGQRPERRS